MDKLIVDIKNEIEILRKMSLRQQNEKNDRFLKLVEEIPLEKLSFDDRFRALVDILKVFSSNYDSNSELDTFIIESDSNLIKVILLKWCNDDLDVDGVIGDLAGNPDCPDKILQCLIKCFPYSTPTTILDIHIRTRYGNGCVFSYIADRILKAYFDVGILKKKNIPEREWSILLDSVRESDENVDDFYNSLHYINRQGNPLTENNKDVIEYIEDKIKETRYQGKETKSLGFKELKPPSWIKNVNLTKDDILMIEDFLKQMSSFVISESNPQNSSEELDFDELKNLLDKHIISESNPQNSSKELENEVIKNLVSLQKNYGSLNSNSESLDMVKKINYHFGPVNSISNTACITFDTEAKHPLYGCRMFSCICREVEEENTFEEEITFPKFEIEDLNQNLYTDVMNNASDFWFKGKCDICDCKIPMMNYAVRFPVDGGGWLGCFCSFTCLKKTEVRVIYESDEQRINEIKNILNNL